MSGYEHPPPPRRPTHPADRGASDGWECLVVSGDEKRAERQARKRREADERNALTPHGRTRAHRLGRCDCDTPEGRLLGAIFGARA